MENIEEHPNDISDDINRSTNVGDSGKSNWPN